LCLVHHHASGSNCTFCFGISGTRSLGTASHITVNQSEPKFVPGQFERGSKALAGAGRPPGSLNKTTIQLREAILGALEAAGGREGSVGYLRRLAIENSSAFASLFGKVLPTTLAAASESDGEIRQLVEVKLNVVRAEPAPLQIEGYSGATEAEPVVEVKEIKDQDE
jgi:hypothetical protein